MSVRRSVAALDSDRTLAGLVVAGLVVTVVFLLLAAVLPLAGVSSTPPAVAWSIPVLGACVVLLAVVSLLRSGSKELSTLDDPTTDREGRGRLGSELARRFDRAREHRYRGSVTSGADEIHDLLRRAAERRAGADGADPARAVEAGTWTEDPVAAGFVSPGRRLPLLERLRGLVDPGRAYERRVDRTLDALDRLDRLHADEQNSSTDEWATETVFAGSLPEGDRERRSSTWAVLFTLGLAGLGIALGRPILVVGSTLGLWYVAAGVLARPPGGSLAVTRRVSAESGDPGDRVAVELALTNTGETLTDLRVVDGVPEGLPVVSGSPRACLSLGPDETARVEYDLELRRGEFSFDPVTVRTTDLTGVLSERRRLAGDGQELRCLPTVERVPVDGVRDSHAGTAPTDESGSGIEFHSVREYETGDPLAAIDWRQYARTRTLATVEHRAEQATRAVCLVDRRGIETDPVGTGLPARDHSVVAARRTVDTLLDLGHPTGLVTLRRNNYLQVDPGTGPETRTTIDALLDAQLDDDDSFAPERTRLVEDPVATLPETLSGETQVFLFSSVGDEFPVELTQRLRSRGFAVTVVSPDVTDAASDTAVRLAGLEREERLARLRGAGVDVLDWGHERPLSLVLQTAVRGGRA